MIAYLEELDTRNLKKIDLSSLAAVRDDKAIKTVIASYKKHWDRGTKAKKGKVYCSEYKRRDSMFKKKEFKIVFPFTLRHAP